MSHTEPKRDGPLGGEARDRTPAATPSPGPRWKELGSILLIWCIGCLVLLASGLAMDGGKLVYCLDDPYVHLAVAQGILDGTYGVNPAEVSSPSSSLLWPLVLVPFVAAGLGEVAPFWINLVCGAATACLLSAGLRLVLPRPGWWGLRVVLVVAILLLSNAFGLVFTGMEHSLQLLLAIAVVHGLLRHAMGKPPGWMLTSAVVLGPWVRYENLAVSAAAWLFLAWTGERRPALRTAVVCLAGLALFSLFLVSQGLDWLPSSVRMKSGMSGADWGFWSALAAKVSASLTSGRGVALTCMSLALLVLAGLRHPFDRVGKLALCLSGAGALHVMFGVYGWFHRYESYIYGSVGFGLVALLPVAVPLFTERVRAQVALAASLVVLAFPYVRGLPGIPLACNKVFEQQYQMHRFVRDFWKGPIAVNDLGYVAFDNHHYVLDLAGLSSPEVQRRRAVEPAPTWIGDLTRRHSVELAMVYANWFPRHPAAWVHVADLKLSSAHAGAAGQTVAFFATHPGAVTHLREVLAEYGPTLPEGSSLEPTAARPRTR